MTTFVTLKLRCPDCSGKFYADSLASFGFANVDEHLCKKYWGYNPMVIFYAMCPHCNLVDFPSNFEMIDDDIEEDLPYSEETCDKYDILIEEVKNGDNSSLNLAHLYHQSACCRKIEGLDYVEYLKKAHYYFKLVKEEGIEEFLRTPIEDWIEATKI
ncbi:MAG: DUF2225 domain-containing protein [Candidatus Lokiarchaeota archaeon]|nr:DUF2225 domain-containing protein [Candidatus Lokiarchaeota archaeon]